MLEGNWRAWKAAKNGENVEKMDMDDSEEMDINKKLEEILQESGFADARSAKMDVDDLLALLATFHKHGFHFAG